MGQKHPGFKAVQASIAKKGGYSMKAAGAILASKTRAASPAAKAKNPNLKKVKMPMKYNDVKRSRVAKISKMLG